MEVWLSRCRSLPPDSLLCSWFACCCGMTKEETEILEPPADRLYTVNHLWVKIKEAQVELGATRHLLETLPALVAVSLPDVDDEMIQEVAFGELVGPEGVHELRPPADATVLEVNERVYLDLDLLRADPYDEGWLLKIQVHEPDQLRSLLTRDAYVRFCEQEPGETENDE